MIFGTLNITYLHKACCKWCSWRCCLETKEKSKVYSSDTENLELLGSTCCRLFQEIPFFNLESIWKYCEFFSGNEVWNPSYTKHPPPPGSLHRPGSLFPELTVTMACGNVGAFQSPRPGWLWLHGFFDGRNVERTPSVMFQRNKHLKKMVDSLLGS